MLSVQLSTTASTDVEADGAGGEDGESAVTPRGKGPHRRQDRDARVPGGRREAAGPGREAKSYNA